MEDLSPEERREIEALRDADTLQALPKEALVGTIKHLAERIVGPRSDDHETAGFRKQSGPI